MLVELRAENYAVIDHAIAELGPGHFYSFDGRNRSGQIHSGRWLGLLMGGKSSADVVRHGSEKASVSCVFETTPGAEAILEENGIEAEGSEIILRREILSTGKGRVFVNNQPATVAVLKQLALNWRLCMRKAKHYQALISSSSGYCLTALVGYRQKLFLKRMGRGEIQSRD